MEHLQFVLVAVVLLVSVIWPFVIYTRLRAEQHAETDRLLSRIEQNLGAGVKLLEVRSYYDQMNNEYKKMIDEAYKAGDKFRVDHIRRLQERLEQLKARTLDRTVRILDSEEGQARGGEHRHRRRGGRRHHRPGGGQAGNRGGQGGPESSGGQPYGAPRNSGPQGPSTPKPPQPQA